MMLLEVMCLLIHTISVYAYQIPKIFLEILNIIVVLLQ